MGKVAKENKTETTNKAESVEEKRSKRRKVRGRVFINEERCKGCGLCIAFCPAKVLEFSTRFNSKGYHPPEARRPDNCTGCDLCGHYCPDFAIFGIRVREEKNNKEEKKK